MFTNENTYIQKEENFFMKLVKTHSDLIHVESQLKEKRIQKFNNNIIIDMIGRFYKLIWPFFLIISTIFLYYFYIYVK